MLIILPWLVAVFSGSLLSGHVPLEWRIARVEALHKLGKTDYTSPRSYCLISLLSSKWKTLGNIVNRRLIQDLEPRGISSPSQFVFRTGREAIGACSRLADDVVQARCEHQWVQAVAVDIQGA